MIFDFNETAVIDEDNNVFHVRVGNPPLSKCSAEKIKIKYEKTTRGEDSHCHYSTQRKDKGVLCVLGYSKGPHGSTL